MRFSQRRGLKPVREALQTDSMDDDLRNSWNEVHHYFLECQDFYLKECKVAFIVAYTSQLHFFKRPISQIEEGSMKFVSRIMKWYRVVRSLGFIEFLRNSKQDVFDDKEFLDNSASDINSVLERKKSGYRFVGADIAPIVEQHEIEAIQECLEAPELFAGARIHIPSALQLYSNRQNPDYRNSIKEAISAIESAACVIAGNAKATLGAALKLIKKKHDIHPAMGEAFEKLYGYNAIPAVFGMQC